MTNKESEDDKRIEDAAKAYKRTTKILDDIIKAMGNTENPPDKVADLAKMHNDIVKFRERWEEFLEYKNLLIDEK